MDASESTAHTWLVPALIAVAVSPGSVNVPESPPQHATSPSVSMPHEKWGEVPKAFVTPQPGSEPDEQSIIDFVVERLAKFKAPKAVEFGPLPKTATGKIQKFKLREKEWGPGAKKIQGA